MIHAVSNSRDAETELLRELRQKFKSAYDESHSTESFYGDYSDILSVFLTITLKYIPKVQQVSSLPSLYQDEIDDPSHEYQYQYYVNMQYIKDRTLPRTLDSNVDLSSMSYNDVRHVCKEYFPDMGIPLTLKKVELEKTMMDCNNYIVKFKGIESLRDRIPHETIGEVTILNLKRLCKKDRLSLRKTLKLKKHVSLEMHYKDVMKDYEELSSLNLSKTTKEEIIKVLSKFVRCDMKMRKDELVKLVQDVLQ